MKKFLLLAVLAIAVSTTQAQEKQIPRNEFTVELSETSVEVAAGQSQTVTLSLIRSKSFSKSKAAVGLSSGLPPGVSVTFEPANGMIDESVAKISIANGTAAGSYSIIINTTMQGKSKGAALKVVVPDTRSATVVESSN